MPTKLFYERLDALIFHTLACIRQENWWGLIVANRELDRFMEVDPDAVAPTLVRVLDRVRRSPATLEEYKIFSPSVCPGLPHRNQYSRP